MTPFAERWSVNQAMPAVARGGSGIERDQIDLGEQPSFRGIGDRIVDILGIAYSKVMRDSSSTTQISQPAFAACAGPLVHAAPAGGLRRARPPGARRNARERANGHT